MKVIGHDDKVNKEVTCRHCSAIIEYLPVDVKNYVHHDYSGGSDTVYYFECPECHEDVHVGRP